MYVERGVLPRVTLWDLGGSHHLACQSSQWPKEVGAWGVMFRFLKAVVHSCLARASHPGTVHFQELGKMRFTYDGEKRNQRIPDSLKDPYTIPTGFMFEFLS